MLRFIALVCLTVCVFADGKYDYSTYKKDDYYHKWYDRMYDFGNIGGGISGISVGSGIGGGIGGISVGNGVGEGISGISPGSGLVALLSEPILEEIFSEDSTPFYLESEVDQLLHLPLLLQPPDVMPPTLLLPPLDKMPPLLLLPLLDRMPLPLLLPPLDKMPPPLLLLPLLDRLQLWLPPRPLPLLLPHLISLGSTAPSHTVVNTSTATHHITMGSHISTTVFPFITLTLSNLLDLVDLLPPQLKLPLFLLEPPLEV